MHVDEYRNLTERRPEVTEADLDRWAQDNPAPPDLLAMRTAALSRTVAALEAMTKRAETAEALNAHWEARFLLVPEAFDDLRQGNGDV